MFQECFNEVLFSDFVVAWISSQLPEQKEKEHLYSLFKIDWDFLGLSSFFMLSSFLGLPSFLGNLPVWAHLNF